MKHLTNSVERTQKLMVSLVVKESPGPYVSLRSIIIFRRAHHWSSQCQDCSRLGCDAVDLLDRYQFRGNLLPLLTFQRKLPPLVLVYKTAWRHIPEDLKSKEDGSYVLFLLEQFAQSSVRYFRM